jgi:hypothetical protein
VHLFVYRYCGGCKTRLNFLFLHATLPLVSTEFLVNEKVEFLFMHMIIEECISLK